MNIKEQILALPSGLHLLLIEKDGITTVLYLHCTSYRGQKNHYVNNDEMPITKIQVCANDIMINTTVGLENFEGTDVKFIDNEFIKVIQLPSNNNAHIWA